jgi:flavin reductase (DIM6/NTAB) family NADH-FMN oxidoreductase RutF
MPVSESEFRDALSRFASGVSVVTTRDAAGRCHGITVSAFCSVSLEPPLVLICIEKATASHYAFHESRAFIVNVLDASQQALSEQFAAPAADKFGDREFEPGIEGIPRLKTALASIECRVSAAHDGGDHTIFVGLVEAVKARDGGPLLYFRSEYSNATGWNG